MGNGFGVGIPLEAHVMGHDNGAVVFGVVLGVVQCFCILHWADPPAVQLFVLPRP